MLASFLTYIRCELNFSAHTVSAYTHDLQQWADFATGGAPDNLQTHDVTANDLRLWIASLAKSGDAPRTIRRKIQALRAFFRYMMRYHGMTYNPAAELTLAKTDKPLPVYVRPNETDAILNAPLDTGDFNETRNRLIIDMIYSTGLRCSEIQGLMDKDVDTARGELKVLGKRNKERIIPIGPELMEAIDAYRVLRDSSPDTSISLHDRQAPLLVKADGAPLYRRLVYRVVNRALTEGNVHAARLSPHVLRHSFATDMLNAGAPISSVQQLLGHASLASTQIYTHVTYSELKHNYQLAHPRALKKGGKNGN